MTQMTGSQAVVQTLINHEVDTLFGIIATHTIDLYDALYDVQDEINHIGCRQELALGFMADGYSRVSGKPGVVITSSGPGAAGSMHCMGEAYASSTPVLQVTTDVERRLIGSGVGARHEARDQLAMLQTVTAWSALISEVESIPDYFDRAMQWFKSQRPRPISLVLPTDQLKETADVEIGSPTQVEVRPGDEKDVERTVELIKKARRPILLAGDNLTFSGGSQELVSLAESLGCPVGLLDGAKGNFPDDHPLAVGFVMGNRHWRKNPLWELLDTCDLCVVLGSTILYRDTLGLGLRLPTPLVHVDQDGRYFNKNYPAEVTIEANPRAVLQQLLDRLQGQDVHKGEAYEREAHDWKAKSLASTHEQWPNEAKTWEALREVLPRETVMSFDVTLPVSGANRSFQCYAPGAFINPFGWAGLGYGLPAALGAKVARPETHVVSISGDGGFQYNMQELGTAIQYGIHPIVIVINDNSWGALKTRQQSWMKGRVIASDLTNPDFVRLGEAYGIDSTRVYGRGQLVDAVDGALKADRIHLIEVAAPNGLGQFS